MRNPIDSCVTDSIRNQKTAAYVDFYPSFIGLGTLAPSPCLGTLRCARKVCHELYELCGLLASRLGAFRGVTLQLKLMNYLIYVGNKKLNYNELGLIMTI